MACCGSAQAALSTLHILDLQENLSLSVPDLLKTVKQFVDPDKHGQLDQMLQRYLCKELGKQQVSAEYWHQMCRCLLTLPVHPTTTSCNWNCEALLGATHCGRLC